MRNTTTHHTRDGAPHALQAPANHAGGTVIRFPQRAWEPWVTKQQLAAYLGYTPRWVDYKIHDGLPWEPSGKRKRFRITDVEHWLRTEAAR